MDIIYCMTPNLYCDFKRTVRSLLDHNDATVHLIVEDDGIDGFDCVKINPHDYFTAKSYRFTLMSYARILAPLLFNFDKAIYLDVDTIVCDSLEPLWAIDMTGKQFGAVPERPVRYNPYDHELYYNAGVLLMNMAQLRADDMVKPMVDGLNGGIYLFGEQDAINHLCYDKTIELPVRFNESTITGQTEAPAIVHYAGFVNWQKGNIARSNYRDKYFS